MDSSSRMPIMPKSIVLLDVTNPIAKAYAQSLAQVLNLPIVVYIGGNRIPKDILGSQSLFSIQKERINALVPGAQVTAAREECLSGIIVSNRMIEQITAVGRVYAEGEARPRLNVLAPQSEKVCKLSPQRNILVPIGRTETALRALRLAIWIAAQTGSPIVLYHSTRPQEGLEDLPWIHHMKQNARAMLLEARAACGKASLCYEEMITSVFPEQINTGISIEALLRGSHLVVMAIADDVYFGSHTASVYKKSPVPLLIAG